VATSTPSKPVATTTKPTGSTTPITPIETPTPKPQPAQPTITRTYRPSNPNGQKLFLIQFLRDCLIHS
jgi:hypothetical protein